MKLGNLKNWKFIMLKNDLFGNRMKEYERTWDFKLTNRLPVIIRLDGNSFSKFTKKMNFEKPIDERFVDAMAETTKAVLEFCSGSQFGYFQSDEITIFLRNDLELNTDSFLANRIQKICSLVSSVASVSFCNYLNENKQTGQIKNVYAVFDCRVFVVPETEVNNVFLWRQMDAFRNYVNSFAYWKLKDKYGTKEVQKLLFKKKTNEVQEIIYKELGVNINDMPVKYRRGIGMIKKEKEVLIDNIVKPEILEKFPDKKGTYIKRNEWECDYNIPRFNEDKNYINKFLKGNK